MRKDLRTMLEEAQALGVALPVSVRTLDVYDESAREDKGRTTPRRCRQLGEESAPALTPAHRLFDLDAGVLDEFAVFRHLGTDERAELLGRAVDRFHSEVREPLLGVGVLEHLHQVAVEFLGDRLRRSAGMSTPHQLSATRRARLERRRKLRHERTARRARDAESARSFGFDELHRGKESEKIVLDVPGDDILHRQDPALVGTSTASTPVRFFSIAPDRCEMLPDAGAVVELPRSSCKIISSRSDFACTPGLTMRMFGPSRSGRPNEVLFDVVGDLRQEWVHRRRTMLPMTKL